MFVAICGSSVLQANDFSSDIAIELFTRDDSPVREGDTVSGTLTGKIRLATEVSPDVPDDETSNGFTLSSPEYSPTRMANSSEVVQLICTAVTSDNARPTEQLT